MVLYMPLGILALLASSFLSLQLFRVAIVERTIAQLSSINMLKKIQVEEVLGRGHIRSSEGVLDNRITRILSERTGMGLTGESYLISNHGFLASQSRFLDERNTKNLKVLTRASREGLEGFHGKGVYPDYRGIEVIGVFSPILSEGQYWVLVSEIDLKEALIPVLRFRNYLIYTAIAVSGFWFLISFWISFRLSARIMSVNRFIEQVATGDLTGAIPETEEGDEISAISRSMGRLVDSLSSISGFAEQIGRGNFGASYQSQGPQDSLGNAILKMRSDLIHLTEKEGILMRQKTTALLEGEERERKRIAMDLHDGLGQQLTALRFKLASLNSIPPDVLGLLEDCVIELRRISNNVMPSVLFDFGLEAGLNLLASNTQSLTGLKVRVDYFKSENSSQLPFEILTSLYRIAQEGLNNAVKHAQAQFVFIRVEKNEDEIKLSILDDGSGFYTEKIASGKGLVNMQERTKLLNGSFHLSSSPLEGTRIEVVLPLR